MSWRNSSNWEKVKIVLGAGFLITGIFLIFSKFSSTGCLPVVQNAIQSINFNSSMLIIENYSCYWNWNKVLFFSGLVIISVSGYFAKKNTWKAP